MTYVTYSVLGEIVDEYNRKGEFDLFGRDLEDHNDELTAWLQDIADEHNDEYPEDEKSWVDYEYEIVDYSDDIPEYFINQTSIDDEYFDYAQTVADSHLDEEVFLAGLALDIPHDKIEDAYLGSYDSDGDWAYENYKDSSFLDECPEHLINYIDWDAVGRDESMSGYISSYDHHYFSNHW